MSPSTEKTVIPLEKAREWLSPTTALGDADLVDDLERVASTRSEIIISAGWMLAKASPHVEVIRSFSFLLATMESGRLDDRLGALLDLISSSKIEKEPSSIINIITAIRRTLPNCELGLANLFGLVIPSLVQTAFQSVPLVAEAAIDLLMEIEDEDLAHLIFGPRERFELINATLSSRLSYSRHHIEALAEIQGRLFRTKKKASTEFEFSPLVRFQETLRRLQHDVIDDEQLQETLKGLIQAYNTNLLSWRLWADARRLNTPVHQLRIMNRAGDTPNFDVVSRIVQLWQEFVGSLKPSNAKELSFRPFAAAHGSFVLSLAVSSTPTELKKILTDVPSTKTNAQADLPPAWFDLCTLLANEQLRLECSIADPQDEPFHAFKVIEPKEKPAPPSQRRKNRWKWDLRSIDVPQADSIERVFDVVEIINRGNEPTADGLDVEPRQVAYYRRAAISLGLLEESGRLTAAGDRLVSLNEVGKFSLAAVLFETSACGGAWTDWSNARTLADVDENTAVAFLTDTVRGLSESTALRRSKTLIAWHRVLMPYHYKKLNLPAYSRR